MTIAEVLATLENSAVAHAISKSNHMVAASLQVVHVIGFVLLLAALVLIALRLLGWSFKNQPVADVAQDANRLLYLGLGLVVVSGTLMFVATPQLYFYKPAFELKMLLFVGAVTLQFTVLRKLARGYAVRGWATRAVIGLSLVVWFGIGFVGRMIGFT